MARKFFYVCTGLLCLALAYHLGAQSAGAQAPGNPIVGVARSESYETVVTVNGDTYESIDGGITWRYMGNVFGGAPTPTREETLGQVKARYR